MKYIASFLLIASLLVSCELLDDAEGLLSENELTEAEIVDGLKSALQIGTDTSTAQLSKVNGYYGDVLIKILLPDEVANVQQTIQNNNTLNSAFNNNLISFDGMIDNIVLAINRSAEHAAQSAAPIFVDAITDMSISEAWDILNGTNPLNTAKNAEDFDSIAATEYFKGVTMTALVGLYGPEIDKALDQPLVLNASANSLWDDVTGTYNNTINSNILTSTAANIAGLPANIDTDLGDHCTEKALDGLFYYIGIEEKKIRRDPFQWAVDIIQKVFGSLL